MKQEMARLLVAPLQNASIEQSIEFNIFCGEYFEQEFPARVTVGIQLMSKSTG